jgi:hypothetical protein
VCKPQLGAIADHRTLRQGVNHCIGNLLRTEPKVATPGTSGRKAQGTSTPQSWPPPSGEVGLFKHADPELTSRLNSESSQIDHM